MPTQTKQNIRLNLLNPQSNPEKIYVRAMRWVLSTGRYILIVVELVVFAAFLSRFYFDANLANNTELIEEKIPFVESFKPEEMQIRQTQQQLAIVKTVKKESPDYTAILSSIASQTPLRVSIDGVEVQKSEGNLVLKISGKATNNSELSSFVKGLQADENFSDVVLNSVGLEEGIITFTITGNALFATSQQHNL